MCQEYDVTILLHYVDDEVTRMKYQKGEFTISKIINDVQYVMHNYLYSILCILITIFCDLFHTTVFDDKQKKK